MIGDNYGTGGICLKYYGSGDWGISLDFFDSGFEKASTEGTLRCRYVLPTEGLSDAIDTLVADAKRLGIVFRDTTIFVPGDGEWKGEQYHDLWREIVAVESARLGWRNSYSERDGRAKRGGASAADLSE